MRLTSLTAAPVVLFLALIPILSGVFQNDPDPPFARFGRFSDVGAAERAAGFKVPRITDSAWRITLIEVSGSPEGDHPCGRDQRRCAGDRKSRYALVKYLPEDTNLAGLGGIEMVAFLTNEPLARLDGDGVSKIVQVQGRETLLQYRDDEDPGFVEATWKSGRVEVRVGGIVFPPDFHGPGAWTLGDFVALLETVR